MIFPYLNDEPVLSIKIRNKSGDWIPFHGYLDSGAGYSVFHLDVAEILGIKIYQGKKIFLTVGDGAKIESYIHKLPVKFSEKEFTAEISFSPSLGTGTNILGMKSFFDNFHICFNNKKQQVEVNSL
ncbi:hypothetical protein HY357_03330 [Candidatus Roizmanbacteria bacterium]|nr:hypothetical protein [Candidatus Roizmanbacteria bacterium]